jgi:hypothetical protein
MDCREIELLKVCYEKHFVAAFEHFSRAGLLFCISELYGVRSTILEIRLIFNEDAISLHAYTSSLFY